MAENKPKSWWHVKGEIIQACGSLSACASKLNCSVEGLRGAVKGTCPGIANRLNALLEKKRRELTAV